MASFGMLFLTLMLMSVASAHSRCSNLSSARRDGLLLSRSFVLVVALCSLRIFRAGRVLASLALEMVQFRFRSIIKKSRIGTKNNLLAHSAGLFSCKASKLANERNSTWIMIIINDKSRTERQKKERMASPAIKNDDRRTCCKRKPKNYSQYFLRIWAVFRRGTPLAVAIINNNRRENRLTQAKPKREREQRIRNVSFA